MRNFIRGLAVGVSLMTLAHCAGAWADRCSITQDDLHRENWEISPLYRLSMVDRNPGYDVSHIELTKAEALAVMKDFLKKNESLAPDDTYHHRAEKK